jgi:hypothetical protein
MIILLYVRKFGESRGVFREAPTARPSRRIHENTVEAGNLFRSTADLSTTTSGALAFSNRGRDAAFYCKPIAQRLVPVNRQEDF